MKKFVFIAVIILLTASCSEKGKTVSCEQFPQDFIAKYIPYEKNQKVVFISDPNVNGIVDTMNFVVTEVYFWESYDFDISPDVDCEGYCEPVYVKMKDTTKNIILEYQIQVINSVVYFDISIDNAHFDSQIIGTPQHFNHYMDAITFARKTDVGFFVCDIYDYQGIAYFEEKTADSNFIGWFLVSDQTSQIQYISAKKKGC
ncbi:MAG: hypothetical protein LBV75_00790 [Paludibacter sp.]|jgi:hypothetical protein|nr:hypothetical protein [Paludibacter sp.]